MLHSLFGRKQAPRVQRSFADEVLDLESRLDVDFTFELVQRLIDIHSQAIEHYSALKDPKYLLYQHKLNALLARPMTQALLEGKHQSKPNPILLTRVTQAHATQTSQTFKRVQVNLQNQHTSLHEKILKRKRRRSSLQLDNDIEHQIQSVLETFIHNKLQVQNKVKAKYEEHFADLKEIADSALAQRVLQQLRNHMNKEVEAEVAQLETIKEQQIFEVKKRLS